MTKSNALDYRLDTFGIFPNDIARLPQVSQKVRRHAPKALDKLYAMIAADPEMMAMFGSSAGVASARSRQGEHWNQVFSSKLQPNEMASSNRIGLTHARIGLEPKRYIGGYSILISELITSILRQSPLGRIDGGRTAGTITTLVKVALLDMSVAISAYFEAEEQERNDVIARLADALAALSNGEFVNELGQLPASFARIHQDFEAMRQHIDGALSEVAVTASSLGSGAAEIRQASDDLARRTEQQAASLEETAAALNRITSDVREAATGAGEARTAMSQADLEATEGGAILRDAVQAMGDIQGSAQQIGNIVEVIDGIAFQTNLLALNAGVEAARAGDSGKGFAVVANEVRALAQRSADAANDIKALIRASSSHVERGVALVGQSGEAFARIAGKVGEIGGLVTAIADASERQAQGLHLVNSAVHDMDLTTQQNAAMVEQTNAAAHSLDGQAARLTTLVGQFTLSGAVSVTSAPSRVVPMRPVARPVSTPSLNVAPVLRTGTASKGDSWAEF